MTASRVPESGYEYVRWTWKWRILNVDSEYVLLRVVNRIVSSGSCHLGVVRYFIEKGIFVVRRKLAGYLPPRSQYDIWHQPDPERHILTPKHAF